MADLNGFDARQVDPNVAFVPIPAGEYIAAIVRSERKPTKDNQNAYLEIELEVLEGPEKGRRIFDRLVMWHSNETTVRIARGQLSAICHAVNVMQPRDSAELHNLPMRVAVGIKNREDNNEPTNVVKGYSPKGGGSQPAPQAAQRPAPQPQQQQPQAAPTGSNRAPWQK